MDYERYLDNLPMLHTWDGGKTWSSGGFTSSQLNEMRRLFSQMGDGLSFIETGAGNSTLNFLFSNPKIVTSIAPDKDLFDRIDTSIKDFDLNPAKLQRIIDGSEWALPQLALNTEQPTYDICLIDGEHNFPNVFIDFFYMNYMLKEGGVVLIDDLQIYSCNQLSEFLRHEKDYELVIDIDKLKGYRRVSNRRILSGWKSGYNIAMQK